MVHRRFAQPRDRSPEHHSGVSPASMRSEHEWRSTQPRGGCTTLGLLMVAPISVVVGLVLWSGTAIGASILVGIGLIVGIAQRAWRLPDWHRAGRRHRTTLWLASWAPLVIGLAGLACGHRSLPFEPSAWQRAGPHRRWHMMESLLATHALHGLSFAEVCELLGPDKNSNCERFDPYRGWVKVMAPPTELIPTLRAEGHRISPTMPPQPGRRRIVDTRPGPPCRRSPEESGIWGMFGGHAPHFAYRLRPDWLAIADQVPWLGAWDVHLVLIFCEEGTVDMWLYEAND